MHSSGDFLLYSYNAVYNKCLDVHYCVFTDAARPSGVRACISYNATGFAHLNLQWEVVLYMIKYT